MMRALLPFLVGCTSSAWNLPAKLDPQGGETWQSQVAEAAAMWDGPLWDCPSGPPFLMSPGDGMPVVVVPASSWADRGEGGWETDARIEVEDAPVFAGDLVPVTLHELGHALGLGHVDPSVDVFSVMKPFIGTLHAPSPGDIRRARALLGCP